MPAETFGSRLRGAMKRAGVDNSFVAEVADVHVKTVSAWLNDRFQPEEDKATLVADALKVPLSWLRYGAEDRSPMLVREEATPRTHSLVRRRLPPRLYEVVFAHLERMREKRCSQEQIDEAERLMTDYAYAQLHADPRRAKTIDEQLVDLEAAWKAVKESVQRHSGITL